MVFVTLSVCVAVLVMSAYVPRFTGACGARVSDVYMLNRVGDRTPPCITPVLNWRCVCFVSECSVFFASFEVGCDEFENGGWDVSLL